MAVESYQKLRENYYGFKIQEGIQKEMDRIAEEDPGGALIGTMVVMKLLESKGIINKGKGRMKAECDRCGKITEVHRHHPYRRNNNREVVVDLCWECHHWAHMNPREAKEAGYYLKMDGKYRRKPRKKMV